MLNFIYTMNILVSFYIVNWGNSFHKRKYTFFLQRKNINSEKFQKTFGNQYIYVWEMYYSRTPRDGHQDKKKTPL